MTDSQNQRPEKPEKLPIPPSGNLGLLAYGYKGLLAWRKARAEAAQLASQSSPVQDKNS